MKLYVNAIKGKYCRSAVYDCRATFVVFLKWYVVLVLLLLFQVFCVADAAENDLNTVNESRRSRFDTDDEFREDSGRYIEETSVAEETRDNAMFTDFRFTLAHTLAYATHPSEAEMVVNRSQLRCEIDHSLTDVIFVRVDGKTTLFMETDHQAEAEDDSVVNETHVREAYVQVGLDRMRFRIGQRIIVWGKTDGDVINDVVSPRDTSEFVFVDLENARIGQFMLSGDVYSRYGEVSFFMVPTPMVNAVPDHGTRYFRESVSIKDDTPDDWAAEWGVKWKHTVHKLDIAVMGAFLYQNDGVLISENASSFKRQYPGYHFYGVGASYAVDGFLLKFDASLKTGHALGIQDGYYALTVQKNDLADTAVGLEYDANGKYTLNLELTNRYIMGDGPALSEIKRNRGNLHVMLSKQFYNEIVTAQYQFYYRLQDQGSVHKAMVEYDVSDNIQFRADYVFLDGEKERGLLWEYRHEDRFGIEISYYL